MLFTIGTSNRTADEFFAELTRRDIWLMVDVRSSPSSRSPWACRRPLEIAATRHGLQYAWSGALLGGRNPIATTAWDFQVAAAAILDATDNGPVAIFCAEGDPAQCHRSAKIAAHLLLRHQYEATNVLRDGRDETAPDTLRRTKAKDLAPCLKLPLAALLDAEPYRIL